MYLEKRQGEERRWQQAVGYINSKRTDGKLWFLEISISSNCSSLIKHQMNVVVRGEGGGFGKLCVPLEKSRLRP